MHATHVYTVDIQDKIQRNAPLRHIVPLQWIEYGVYGVLLKYTQSHFLSTYITSGPQIQLSRKFVWIKGLVGANPPNLQEAPTGPKRAYSPQGRSGYVGV